MISNKNIRCALAAALVLGSAPAFADIDMFASDWANAIGLGEAPYDSPAAIKDKPTLKFMETNGNVFASSLVAGPWNTDPAGNNVVTTIELGGEITAVFAAPIEDDPANWYGMDFIVFGNSAFNGGTTQYITPSTDMATYKIATSASGRWEKSVVSVSQSLDGPWYTYSSGPYADDFAPTQAYAWDYIRHTWGAEMDFTKPIDPTVAKSKFGGKYAADAIDLYKSSGGGTAFDISALNLPVNSAGRKWIKYVKITGNGGELDAVARVGHAISAISVGQAKNLPDGSRVILNDLTVSAGTDDFSDCCYLQSKNAPCAIKLAGRTLLRGSRVNVQGVMATDLNGEREVQATCLEVIELPVQ